MQKLGKVFFRILLLAFLLSAVPAATVFAQTTDSAGAHVSKSAPQATKAANTAAPADNSADQPLLIHPILRLGTGVLSYIGNAKSGLGTSTFQNPASGRIGYEMALAQKLSPVTEFNLYFLYGNLSVTQRTTTVNWNFQSTIAGGGINLLFKFLPKNELTPYAIIGVESYEFFSRADVYDAYGNQYYNWTDGSLRSLPQTASNAASAKILNQDYSYETDIRSLNLDGSGKYTQQTFAIPVGLGFMMRIGTRADFMVGTTLHYTFTDHIDGLTPQNQGVLQGSLSHDMFLMSYVSLRFNLTRDHPKSHRYDDIDKDPYLLKDTVHPYTAGQFDTSAAAQQLAYEKYMDSTGRFGKTQVDPFSWKVKNPIVRPTEVGKTTTTASVKTTTVTPPITPANSANVPQDVVVYKVQLLATYVKLAEGITFAGINDKASIDIDRGMYRYTTGNFTNFNDAVKYLSQLRGIGYTDAFITASKNGKIIPVSQGSGTPKSTAANTSGAKSTSTTQAAPAGSGLVFKLQLGVFGAIAPDQSFMSTLNQFKDVSIVKDNAGLNHYLVGSYKDFSSASAAKDQLKAGGVKDACVMAFNNGRYISNADAQAMQKK